MPRTGSGPPGGPEETEPVGPLRHARCSTCKSRASMPTARSFPGDMDRFVLSVMSKAQDPPVGSCGSVAVRGGSCTSSSWRRRSASRFGVRSWDKGNWDQGDGAADLGFRLALDDGVECGCTLESMVRFLPVQKIVGHADTATPPVRRPTIWSSQNPRPLEPWKTSLGSTPHLLSVRLVYHGQPCGEDGRRFNENQVAVAISGGFYLGKCSVTQAEYKAVMGTTPWAGQRHVKEGDDYPATCVDWQDAVEFCREVNMRESQAGALCRQAMHITCPPRPSGSMPAGPGQLRPFPSATMRTTPENTHGGDTPSSVSAMKRRRSIPNRSAKRNRMLGASTTCTETCGSGAAMPTGTSFVEERTRLLMAAGTGSSAADAGPGLRGAADQRPASAMGTARRHGAIRLTLAA